MKKVYSTAMRGLVALLLLACFSTTISADNYYWVNGSGDWSDFAGHWAKIPNPTLPAHYHANIPTDTSDVYFGANGGTAYTVNVNGAFTVPKCRNMDWTGVPAGTVWGGGGGRMDIYGSLTMDANMSMTFNNEIHFISNEATTKQIWSKTVHFSSGLFFEGTDGGWQFMDELYCESSIYHWGGFLNTNGQKVTVIGDFRGNYQGPTDGQLHLGSSEFNIVSYGYFNYSPGQFDAGTSHIKFLGANVGLVGPINFATPINFYDVSFLQVCTSGGFTWGNIDGTLTFHQFGRIYSHSLGGIPVLKNVVFLEDGWIANATNYMNLTFTAGKTYTVENHAFNTGTDQTILPGGTLTALGAGTCSQFITIKSWQYGTHFNFVNNSGAQQTVHCAILEDCHAIGSDPLEVIDGVNLGNNTGWIFTAPNPGLDLYWVGGAGDWNDPCHWTDDPLSLVGDCGCLPNGASNVHFTANSGFSMGDVVDVTGAAYCYNMDWVSVTGLPTFQIGNNQHVYIYSSMTLAPPAAMGLQSYGGSIHFRGFDTDNVVTLAGQALDYVTYFEGTGLYKFGDAFTSKFFVSHTNGEVRTMGFPVQVLRWYGNSLTSPYPGGGHPTAKLWLGDPVTNVSSTLTLSDAFYGESTYFINEYDAGQFMAMQSHIIAQGSGQDYIQTVYTSAVPNYWNVSCPTGCSFYQGNVLNKLSFNGSAVIGPIGDFHEVDMDAEGTILGDHHYDILTLYGGRSYNIQNNLSGYTQTINTGGVLNVVNANCEKRAYLYSGNPIETAKIAKTSGALNLQYVILDNVLPDLTTGATYSASNSVGIQPQVVTDWTMDATASRNLLWVGGSGTWHDSNHWSLASGGAGGECPPTPEDNVRFDAASGLGAGSVVDVTQRWAFCKDMDWTGVTGGAKFYTVLPPYTPNQIAVFGSLTFSSGMVNDFAGAFWMRAKGPATITSAGNHFLDRLIFYEPTGDWSLTDPLWVDAYFDHYYGKFRTMDFPVKIGGEWRGAATPTQEAFLGSSTINMLGTLVNAYNINYAIAALYYYPNTFHPGTSHFIFESAQLGAIYGNGYNPELYNVTFKSDNNNLWGASISNKLVSEKLLSIYYANGNNYIHDAEFQGDTYFGDSRPYHKFKLFPGKRYTFATTTTTTLVPHNGIEGQFIAQGLPGQYIEMKSSDPSTPAIIHKDDYDGTSTCTKYLFLTGMTHTGTEDIYVPTPGGDVFNNAGWQFFPCNPCPATIPVLDAAASITTGCPPGTAKLVLAGLKPDEWANWYTDPAATTDLVYSGGTPGPAGNLFQPAITGPVTYYARVYSDGGLCESTVVLAVDITITSPPAAFNVSGGGLVCSGSNGTPVGLDGSVVGVSYQLQLDGSDTGSPLAGTGAALDFGLQTAAGTYTVVANADGTSCPVTMTGAAVVTGSQNQAPAVVAAGNSPLCTPADLFLVEYGGAATTWNWTGPGGFVSSDQNPVLANASPANSGTYTVVVSDGLGCTNIGSVGVMVSIPETAYCPTDTSLCINYGLFDLSWGGWPTGGSFSGPGVSQNQFDPAVAGPGVHVLSYSVYDANNCPVSCNFNYTVFAAPVMDCPNDTVVCLSGASPFALTGATPAGGTYAGPGVTAGAFDPAAAGIGQHVITYTAYTYGCAGTCTYVITVSGDQTPTITDIPDMTVSCDQPLPAPSATALSYLGDPIAYIFSENVLNSCAQAYSIIRTYTAADPLAMCNGIAYAFQIISVVDWDAPVLVGVPGDVTVSSDQPLPQPTVTAIDNCDPNPNLMFSEVTLPGVCPVGYVIERTWSAEDDCGNPVLASQTITVMTQAAISGTLTVCGGQGTTLTASGGVSYAWSTGATTPSIAVSPAGATTYTVVATDGNGCTASASATVAVAAPIVFSVTPAPPSCNGATDGSLSVSGVSGGQAPYQYALNGGGFQNIPVFGGLGVGMYTVKVKDANDCVSEQQVQLPQGPDQPLAIQCPTNIPALTANSSCRAFLGDYTGLATLSGGCGIQLNPIVQTPAPGTVVNPGTVAITLTVSNVAGQSATCRFNVTVSGGCGH